MNYFKFLFAGLVSVSLAFAAPKTPSPTTSTPAPKARASYETLNRANQSAAQAAPAAPAAPSNAAVSETTVIAPGSEATITGILDIRPTFKYSDSAGNAQNRWTTENTVGLGYRFNPDTEIGITQYFNTNIFDADNKTNTFSPQDGFVRAKFGNIWKNDSGLSLSYEPRAYYPTEEGKRNLGLVGFLRNYLTLSQKLSDSVSLSLYEIPIIHFYSKAGGLRADGTQVANPTFENRVYLIADFRLGAGFALSVPLFFHQTRHANYLVTATNNNDWEFYLYAWPELTYSINSNLSVGVAYRTESFLKADSAAPTATSTEAFREGVFQGILTLNM